MRIQLIVFFACMLILTACGSSNKPSKPSPDNAMSNTFWVLENIGGETFYEIGNTEREIGFKLDEDNNRITGYGGCNRFMGDISARFGNRVDFENLSSTKMSCPDLTFDELDILNVLEEARFYRVVDGKLEFRERRKDEPLAVFRKSIGSGDVKAHLIVEKYWKLKTLNGKDVEMSEDQDQEPHFILKTEGGKVSGFAGCNNLLGSYKLGVGNRIHFYQMGTTMMACPDMEKEEEFLKVFELADNYTVNGDELLLNEGKKAPLAAFEAVQMD